MEEGKGAEKEAAWAGVKVVADWVEEGLVVVVVVVVEMVKRMLPL